MKKTILDGSAGWDVEVWGCRPEKKCFKGSGKGCTRKKRSSTWGGEGGKSKRWRGGDMKKGSGIHRRGRDGLDDKFNSLEEVF